MDLKDMRLFLAIAEENNLTRAAQKNGYTQSAASHMLRNIETELGFSLFSRSQRGLALTRNGEALLPPIRRTLAAAEYFDQTAASIRGVQTGHIRIGAYLSASVQWLPPALKKFLSDYPDMTDVHRRLRGGWKMAPSISASLAPTRTEKWTGFP